MSHETDPTDEAGTPRRTVLKTGATSALALATTGIGTAAAGSWEDGDDEDESERTNTPITAGSYPTWLDLEPSEDLDLVDISYAEPQEDGSVAGDGDAYEMFAEMDTDNIDVIVKVGSWEGGTYFSDAAANEENRARFANSLIEDFCRQYDLDGVEINWEFPLEGEGHEQNVTREDDLENYYLLLETVRERFNEAGEEDGQDYLLSLSKPLTPHHAESYDVPRLAELADYAKFQGYSMTGNWAEETSHNAPLFSDNDDDLDVDYHESIHQGVQIWAEAGFPREQMLLGTPGYGKMFHGVEDSENGGLGQSFDEQSGTVEYRNVEEMLDDGFERYWDDVAKVPYIYNSDTDEWASVADLESIFRKAEYVLNEGMAGMQVWELSFDSDDHDIVSTIHDSLRADE